MMNAIINEMNKKGFDVNVVEAQKNGIVKKGLAIRKSDASKMTMAPVMYFDDLCQHLIDFYNEHNKIGVNLPDGEDILDKNYLADRVILGIRPKTENTTQWKEDYLDLELYMRCIIDDTASFCLPINAPDVKFYAIENTRRNLKVVALSEVVAEMTGLDVNDLPDNMYIVKSKDGKFGASALYFPEIFREFCMEHDLKKCAIIPSSVHELLILTIDPDADPDFINGMINDVNSDVVAPEEVLGDHFYVYDMDTDEITY